MTRREIIAAWSAQADDENSWHHLGEDEKLEWAMKLEREACAEVCKKQADVYAGLEQNPTTQSAWAACIDNRDAIRARGQA
jgi:hypothetical protein